MSRRAEKKARTSAELDAALDGIAALPAPQAQPVADRSAEARLAWLHSPASNNVDGWEWGIFKVRWGRREGDHQIRHTFADFSDLDAAMGTPQQAEQGSKP